VQTSARPQLDFVERRISFPKYFGPITKLGGDILNHSQSVASRKFSAFWPWSLTLRSQNWIVTFGADIEHPCRISRKSDFYFWLNKALDENWALSYGTSPAIWDHTVSPATRHKWTRPASTPASKLVLDLPTKEGWKAELTKATRQCTGRESNSRSIDHKSDAVTTTLPSRFSITCLYLGFLVSPLDRQKKTRKLTKPIAVL